MSIEGKKIPVGYEIKDTNGIPIESFGKILTMKTVIVNSIMSGENKGENILEMYRLGLKINDCNDEYLELQDSDYSKIKSILEKSKLYTILAAGQILEKMEELNSSSEK